MMTREELIEKLENSAGKTAIIDGYLYSYALIKRYGEQKDTLSIVKRPEIGGEYEVVCYVPHTPDT